MPRRVKEKKKEPIPIHPELAAFAGRIRQAEQRVRNAEEELEQVQDERDEVLFRLVNEKLGTTYDPESLVEGYWECPTSPSGKCVYDDDEDGCHDSCLFCGDPEERK